ncbi:Histone-lysine N-methyltransferase, H3 lysine-9 specific SUVH6 [Morus notabilis]|uniref:Histone-lysine N-methyltransferase, H3 lysine-9 specific SUVH6 n=2 Tax=Morus notabilis TaxID=981085 RepID=W9S0E6_9ROSA|nr:Histone-lysine N-methyltransferase, H3 lysine-9 specific SUVH6 [Morus notabilis]
MRTTTLVNGSHSDRLEKLTMENGQCSFLVSLTKYKRRKISAVRDFPAGCGRYAQRLSLRPTEATGTALTNILENVSFKDGRGDGLENGTSDLLSDLRQVVAATKEDIIPDLLDHKFLLPANESIAISNGNGLNKRVVRKYPPRRRVSAIREFPPFCGRNASPLGKEESLEVLSSPKNKSVGLEKSECEMIDKTSTEAVIVDVRQTAGDALDGDLCKIKFERKNSKVTGDTVQSKESAKLLVSTKNKFFGQVNIDDTPLTGSVKGDVKQTLGDVPPKESLEVLASPKNKSCDPEKSRPGMNDKPSTEIVNVDLKQTVEDIPAGDSYMNELELNGAKVIKDKIQHECDKNATTDDNVVSSEMKVDQEERENCNEPPFEEKLYWWDHEFETVVGKDNNDVEGSEEHVGKEIVVYSGEKTPDEKCSVTSDYQNQSQVADVASLEVAPNRVIVHGLLAPSNSLWQEMGARKSKLTAGPGKSESKEKKLDVINMVERQKTKITARKKVDGNDAKGKSLKNISAETASQGAGQLVIWDKEDSVRHNGRDDPHVVPKSRGNDVFIFPICPVDSSSTDQDNDAIVARHKVRETLRLFQGVYRKFLQEEETKSKEGGQACKRIDFRAAHFLKEKNKYINTHKILGAVPGVEVGDEFQYRVELHIIGLHRPIQGGIDFVREGGKILATSIVASGGYADDLDYSDVLIYTGQGGNVMNSSKEPEDQKLERGNLALKNSMYENNPVRVIRGCELSDGKSEGKSSRTYVYDGLYLVEKFWQDVGPHGKLVFKFQLERIPGQPELAWKEVKKVKKYNVREGVCVDDISKGKEVIPICAVNTIDDEKPPPFKYITSLIYPDWCKPTPPKGCNCTTRCSDSAKCACAVKNGGEIPFNHNGAIVEVKPLVYECGPSCRCPPSCPNRVSQHGIKFQLEIFKTKDRGWGVRSLNFIPSGSFICEYLGEFLSDKEAEARTGNDEYLFDIGNNYNDNTLWEGLSTLMPSSVSASDEIVEDSEGFTIDAAEYGNVGRFINHSCTPNLYAQNVLYDHEDKRIPHIMLFAAENIRPLEELTYHYNYVVDQVRDSNGNIKKKSCFCGSHECTGRLY